MEMIARSLIRFRRIVAGSPEVDVHVLPLLHVLLQWSMGYLWADVEGEAMQKLHTAISSDCVLSGPMSLPISLAVVAKPVLQISASAGCLQLLEAFAESVKDYPGGAGSQQMLIQGAPSRYRVPSLPPSGINRVKFK